MAEAPTARLCLASSAPGLRRSAGARSNPPQLPGRRSGIAVRAAARSATFLRGSIASAQDLAGRSQAASSSSRNRQQVVTRCSPQSGGAGKASSAPVPPAPEQAPSVPMTFDALMERLNSASAAKQQISAKVAALEAEVRIIASACVYSCRQTVPLCKWALAELSGMLLSGIEYLRLLSASDDACLWSQKRKRHAVSALRAVYGSDPLNASCHLQALALATQVATLRVSNEQAEARALCTLLCAMLCVHKTSAKQAINSVFLNLCRRPPRWQWRGLAQSHPSLSQARSAGESFLPRHRAAAISFILENENPVIMCSHRSWVRALIERTRRVVLCSLGRELAFRPHDESGDKLRS